MDANDYLIILAPQAKGNLLTAKGSASFLMDGIRRKADVLLLNCDSNEEIDRILDLVLQNEEQPETNKRYLQRLIQHWNEWDHITEFSSETFLNYMAQKINKKILYPNDIILLRSPLKEIALEESPMPFREEHFNTNHLIVCYPNEKHHFALADKVDIKHFDKHNHVILVNSNCPQDFIPFLKEAIRNLRKLEDNYTNRKRIEYVESVLLLLEDKDKLYHREPNWKMLHRIKKVLGLKNLKMAHYTFMVS